MKTLEVLDKVLAGKAIKETTKRHYREAFRSLAQYSENWPSEGSVINEWLASLLGYADISLRTWFAYVTSAGKYMQKISGRNPDGSFKMVNPCESAERPKVAKKRRRYFTAEELVAIMESCRNEEDSVLIMTLLDSTCRIGELAGLTGGKVGISWLDVEGKTGQRRYRCDSGLCLRLKALAGGDTEAVFKDRFGKSANVNSLKKRVIRIVKSAGVTGSKLGAHTIRHSAGSFVAQVTSSALAVKALLQHDKIETSMEYIHDAEALIQQKTSPFKLVMDRYKASGGVVPKQLTMGDEVIEEVADSERQAVVVSEVEQYDIIEDMLPEIKAGVAVRALLKSDDLSLLRRAMMYYIKSGDAGSDVAGLRYLLRRMLRKAR